ncbi:MAG: MarR family transcriptional regulator [Acidimicrobiales bacterium]
MSRQFSIYTPSLHEIDDLEARLVGAKRRHAERTVATVRKSVLNGGCHHVLFVGPRGTGKTHVVSVCFHRLRNDEELRPRVALAWIREEHYGIGSAADLFRRVIEAVRTDNAGAEIPDGPSSEAVLRTLTRDRHVVVFAENLNDLFRRIGPHGQQALRAVIQETAAVSLVATTPSLFPGVSDAESPFYGTFDTTHIDEMSLDEASELLLRVAELRGDDDLVAALRRPETRPRLQVIQALAGGHPRIWMLFADSLTVGAIDELVPLFLKMLDDLTPYYQDRMRDLEGDQERIVALLCEHLGALSVGEIADRCEIEHRVASTAVGRLEGKGFVRRASHAGKDRRRAYYELREPLLRLCLQVKEARGKPVQLIVDFLRGWYDRTEAWALLAQVPAGSLAVEYLRAAFFPTPIRFDESVLEGVTSWKEAAARVDAYVKVNTDEAWMLAIQALYLYRGGDAAGALAAVEGQPPDHIVEFVRLVAGVRQGTVNPLDARQRLSAYLESESLSTGLMLPLVAEGLEELGDDEGALAAHTRASHIEPGDQGHHDGRGEALCRLGRYEEALAAINDARARGEPSIGNRLSRSIALCNLAMFEELLIESRASVAVAPDHAWTHAMLGLALSQSAQPAGALTAFDEALQLEPSNSHLKRMRIEALGFLALSSGDRKAAAFALQRLDEAVDEDPANVRILLVRGRVNSGLGHLSEAREDLRVAAELEPLDPAICFALAEAELGLDNWTGFTTAAQRGFGLSAGEKFGHTAAYCRLLVSKPDRVHDLIDLYGSHGALAGLGQGLVSSISYLIDPDVDAAVATGWLRAWEEAGAGHDELVIPLRILAAAVAWKLDGDHAHLLRLPAEERAVLEPMLSRASSGSV